MALLEPSGQVTNALADLAAAIQSGKITFHRGRFSGKLNASLTRELRKIGAKWDRATGTYLIPRAKLPPEISIAVSLSQNRFEQVAKRIDKKLADIIPEQIASKLNLTSVMDKTLFKTDKKIQKTLKGLVVSPELTSDQRKRISAEYTRTLQLEIQEWTEKETVELRKRVQELSMEGVRYESLAKEIKKSYGVSESKAKFLARQETNLFLTKVKQSRYEDAGVTDYIWKCVVGSPKHPVRPLHKAHDGKRFSWKSPPIVDDKGNRKNPGQDYNCRCMAVPVLTKPE